MDNISWCSNKKPEQEVEKEVKVVISPEELLVLKNELLLKCNELIDKTNSVYGIASSKELYDSIVTLMSAKRSLNLIHIREPLVDKVIKKEEV